MSEGNGTPVILWHIHRNRVPANLALRLKETEIEAIRVVMQRPCGAQSGNAAADYRYAPKRSVSTAHCHGRLFYDCRRQLAR